MAKQYKKYILPNRIASFLGITNTEILGDCSDLAYYCTRGELAELVVITNLAPMELLEQLRKTSLSLLECKNFYLAFGRFPVETELEIIKKFSVDVYFEFFKLSQVTGKSPIQSLLEESKAIDFAVWYSGMTIDKVKRAYKRYLNEKNQ